MGTCPQMLKSFPGGISPAHSIPLSGDWGNSWVLAEAGWSGAVLPWSWISVHIHSRGSCQKKTTFFFGKSFPNLFTHPKKAIFGAIWGGFEGFGPCLGISHPTHPHLGKISKKKNVFLAASLMGWLPKAHDFRRKCFWISQIEGGLIFGCLSADHLY